MAKPVLVHLTLFGEFPALTAPLMAKFDYHRIPKDLQEKETFLAEKGASVRGIVTDITYKVTEDLVNKLPNLEIVAVCGAGYEFVDVKSCKQNGVMVTNTAGAMNDDVADTAMALILGVMRRFHLADRFVRDGEWQTHRYPLTVKVSGKRIGIVGLGQIGAAIAKRAAAFDCSIGYWGRSEKKGIPYKYFGSITDLAKDSDVLVLACALTEETTRIVNREVLDALGPKGYLVNIARGLVVDERELVQALVEGRLAGAGLDVYEKDPHVPKELFKLDNVMLLPHMGSATGDALQAMAALVVANVEAHFSGEPVLTPVY